MSVMHFTSISMDDVLFLETRFSKRVGDGENDWFTPQWVLDLKRLASVKMLDPGQGTRHYSTGWRLAEQHLRNSAPAEDLNIPNREFFSGYADRMRIHAFEEGELAC